MSDPVGQLDPTNDDLTSLPSPGYAPYGQLIKMLLPRSMGVAIYDRAGSLIWSSTGAEKPELRELIQRYSALQQGAQSTGHIRLTSAGYPAYFATIRSGRRLLGSLIVDLGQTRDVWNEQVIAGLMTPVLRCLESRLELERTVDFTSTRDDSALDLLLEADEDNPEGPSPLHRLVQHTIRHLGCSVGALVITDKNLLVICDAAGIETKASNELLNRTQKNLLAWAQLNNRPMLVNRVGPNPDSLTYKILSCPVHNTNAEVNGVLALFRDTAQPDFDLKDVRILEFIARRSVGILQSRHDPLTGLANRLIFERRVQRAINTPKAGREHALLYVDVDNLQMINETFGYLTGDEVITRLGEAVQKQLRAVDMASRFGGDRFALFLQDHGLPQAKEVAEALMLEMSQRGYVLGDQSVQVTISIGLLAFDSGSGSLGHLLAAAEIACKEAKSQGRNRVVVGARGVESLASQHRRERWSASLEQALANSEFSLEVQPIEGVAISTGEIVGREIFLRLRDLDGGLVAPEKFVDAAQRYQLMAAIDRWVTTHAAQGLKRAAISYADPANRITLNVSEQSLRAGDFAPFVLDALFRARLPVQAFSFDIKESAVVNDLHAAERFIRQMSDAGAHVGLDDFGLGLSSFAHLKNLPVRYLKIDGSLIRRVLTDSYAESVVKGIVKAAEILGVFTIAEHVESEAIAGRMIELDVSFGQGYYYGKPEPLDRVFPQRVLP